MTAMQRTLLRRKLVGYYDALLGKLLGVRNLLL
jgi:hypothetical protein